MKMRVFAIVAVQVMGVAAAYGATRMGALFAPVGAATPTQAVESSASSTRASVSGVPATARNEAHPSQRRSRPPASSALADDELIDPWSFSDGYAATWDADPAMELVEPWAHEHVSPAIAIVDPWPEGTSEPRGGVPLATATRTFSLVIDPWRLSRPEPPTKEFPPLPSR